MPVSANYTNIFELISAPRLSSYRATFQASSDKELYGTYLWCQSAVGSLFPIVQSIEITLRNSIDRAAHKRFGDYWWDYIPCRRSRHLTSFYKNIESAKRKLDADWEKKERQRLNISRPLPLPSPTPIWSHGQIIAATDFSTWQFILAKDFTKATDQNFLWPRSLGKAFKDFGSIDNDPQQARPAIIEIINELRAYRNRLFHHEPIWIKGTGVSNPEAAIATVRQKINKMEKLLSLISPSKTRLLKQAGVLDRARRVCSLHELKLYSEEVKNDDLTKKQKKSLRKLSAKSATKNETSVWKRGGNIYSFSKLR